MSASFIPGRDLMPLSKVPAVPSLFTTFARGHFVRPARFTQPVKAVTSSSGTNELIANAFGTAASGTTVLRGTTHRSAVFAGC
jgi:hypothetical protein